MKVLIRLYHLLAFLIYYLGLVLQSNIQISLDILTPKLRMEPAIVDLKLKLHSENQILAISNLISMTPGSLTLSYDAEQNSLKVHVMHYGDSGNFIRTVERMQDRIMKFIN